MSDLIIDDPCVVFAMERESAPFRKEFPAQERFPDAPCSARFSGPSWLTVLLVHSGIGASNMNEAMEWLLEPPVFGNLPYLPRAIINAGYSGALQDGYTIGDLVLATEIVDEHGNAWQTTWPDRPLPADITTKLHRERILTADQLVTDSKSKRSLGAEHRCVAVDMESAIVARHCTQKSIPFTSVRVISDNVDAALSPHLIKLFGKEGVSILRTVFAVVRRPSLIGELSRLAKDTRIASEKLGAALGELLTLTLPWSDEIDG